MKTCLYKPVFVNPQAYFVFPQLYDMQPKTDDFIEQAIFTGRLIITDLTNNQYTSYQNVNTIDFSQYTDKRIKHEGTQEDPIPYTPPMEIFKDKYYTQNDILYKCTRDSGIPLSHDLSALVGLYVEII